VNIPVKLQSFEAFLYHFTGCQKAAKILFSRKLGGRFVVFYSKIPAEACVKSRFVLAESGGSPNGAPETGFKSYLGS